MEKCKASRFHKNKLDTRLTENSKKMMANIRKRFKYKNLIFKNRKLSGKKNKRNKKPTIEKRINYNN